jgi:Phosphoribosyl-AMP cyclohydrolase/DDE superfamily endonuclease
LPFLTALPPSERYHEQRGRRHKTVTAWARQLIRQVRRWLPTRAVVVVLDSTYAVLDLLAVGPRLDPALTLVTRLRLDAALYDPPPVRRPGTRGAPCTKGACQPSLAQRVADPATVWETGTLRWYGGVRRTVELASGTAVWYHLGFWSRSRGRLWRKGERSGREQIVEALYVNCEENSLLLRVHQQTLPDHAQTEERSACRLGGPREPLLAEPCISRQEGKRGNSTEGRS